MITSGWKSSTFPVGKADSDEVLSIMTLKQVHQNGIDDDGLELDHLFTNTPQASQEQSLINDLVSPL